MSRSADRPQLRRLREAASGGRVLDLEEIVAAGACGLLTTIWLVPGEGTLEGYTTWRGVAWLVLAIAWSFVRPYASHATHFGNGTAEGFWRWFQRYGCDLAVVLVVSGHAFNGFVVIFTTGQKRYAANLLLEWLGFAAAWWVLRGLLASPRWRELLVIPLVATAIACAGLGIWQHYVSLPEMAAEYAQKIADFRNSGANNLARELAQAGIPLTEPGLTLFEKRLVDSREPFGLFALANTFGGMLAATLAWLLAAMFLRDPSDRSAQRSTRVFSAVTLLVVCWCLVLTKSRTAMAGLMVGIGYVWLGWLLSQRQIFSWRSRRPQIGLLVTVLLVIVAPLGFLIVGTWDIQVLQEAPKSLLYRWQYWVGGTRLIAENPWLGVGLGQFRSQYLRVKLPEASEEIADPHNLWIDAWVNGGLLAVMGVVVGAAWLVFHCVQNLRHQRQSQPPGAIENSAAPENPTNAHDILCVMLGGGGAYVVVFAMSLASGAWEDRILVLAVVWCALAASGFAIKSVRPHLTSPMGLVAGAVVLLVHWHGASGFEMPGVLLWSGLMVLLSLPLPSSETGAFRPTCVAGWGLRVALITVTAGSMVWLWLPDVRCRARLDLALRRFMTVGGQAAIGLVESAAAEDLWNPEPWRQLAEIHNSEATNPSEGGSNFDTRLSHISAACAAIAKAQHLDPGNPHLVQREAEYRMNAWQYAENRSAMADAAEFAYRRAHDMYPTSVSIAAGWARAAALAQDPQTAHTAAQLAMKLDDLNRRLGHVERWLSPSDREDIARLTHSMQNSDDASQEWRPAVQP